jgi:hypothetical protein
VACLADKPECVKALLVAGADVNISSSQASANSSSLSAEAPGFVVDFLHENPNKLHAQVCKRHLDFNLIYNCGITVIPYFCELLSYEVS